MRTTRQSSTAPVEEGNLTLQQVMEMMQGLQEAMAASRADQERIQMDLAASQSRNEELRHELRSQGEVARQRSMTVRHLQGSFQCPSRKR